MKSRLPSLRTQIVAWSFVPTAVILLAVALVAFYAYNRVTGDLVLQQSQELTRLSANQFTAEVREYAGTLTAFGRELSPVMMDRTALRQALAAASNRLVIFDGGAVVLNTFGRVIGSQPDRPGLLAADWSGRTYFADLVDGDATAYSNVLPDGPNDAPVIGIAVPILGSHGEFLGGIIGFFKIGAQSTSALYGSIVKLRNGLASESFLVDREGTIFYHYDDKAIGASATSHPAWRLVANATSGAFRTRAAQRGEIVVSYSPIPATPWAVIRETSWRALLAPSQGYRRFLVLLLALGFVVPALVTAWGVRRITHPIRRLTAAAQEIGAGQFGQTLSDAPSAELQQLVTEFNGMSTRLGESYERLRGQNEQFGLVIQGANDGIWDWNVRTGEIFFSDRWKTMLGYEPSELENHMDVWVQLTHPDDVNHVQEQLQNYLQGASPVYQVEHRLRHKDGAYRWILARGIARRDDTGAVHRMAGSHTDISELKWVQGILAGQRHFLEQLTAGVDLGETLTGLACSVEENWPNGRVMIWLLDEASGALKVAAHGDTPPDLVTVLEDLQAWAGENAPSTMALRLRQRIVVDDIASDPRWDAVADIRGIALAHHLRAAWSEPIIASTGQPLGSLSIYHLQPHQSNAQEAQLIATSAHLVGVAVEARRAEEALLAAQTQLQAAYQNLELRVQQRTRALTALNTIAGVVNRSLDLHTILQDALDVCLQLVGVEAGAVYVLDEAGANFIMYAQRQLAPGLASRIAVLPRDQAPFIGPSAEEAPAIIAVATYPEAQVRAALSEAGLHTVIAVALTAKDQLVGALVLGDRVDRALSREDANLFTAIGRQTGGAIESARLRRQAEESAAVAERNRLARELHDSVTQNLYSVTLYAEAAARLLDAGAEAQAARHLRDLRDTAQEALREMRLLIFELRPVDLEKSGLAGAIQARLQSVETRGGMQAELRQEGIEYAAHLALRTQEELYHIAQEALNNALKHSHAERVIVSLHFGPETTELEVRDNGRGFDPAQAGETGGMGLRGLQERVQRIGGRLRLESAPGAGACIHVTAPTHTAGGAPPGG